VLHPSKVEPPVSGGSVIHRQRLLDVLAGLGAKQVVTVAAPAGFGKTTLLADYAAAQEYPALWYTLDERDAEPWTFFAHFLAAGRRCFPDFGIGLDPEDGEDIGAAILTDLLVKACASVSQSICVILDDVQCLSYASPELAKGVDGWLKRLPDGSRLVLSGTSMPFPVLPKMAVQQELLSIGSGELEFTCDEVVQLLRETAGQELSLDEAQHLADVTGGWAAALVVLGQRMKAGEKPGSLEYLRSTDVLYQYICNEQFETLPEATREFLLGSAVLLAQDVPTVNELLGIKDAQQKLETLVADNLLCVPDGENPDTYRYHRLFRAFLVSHLRFTDPDRFHELSLEAATINERALKWEAALYHVIQAGGWDRIVEIIEKVGPRMFEEGRFDALAEWLEGVPDEAVAAEPRLLLWRARSLHYLNQVDRALALISKASEAFEVRGDQVGLAEALMTKGMCLRVKGDYSEALDVLLKARSLAKDQPAEDALMTELRRELGMTLSRCGALNEAIQELSAVVGFYESQGDKYNIAHTSMELAASLAFTGRLSESIGYLERARELWLQLGNDNFLIQTVIALGVAYYWSGDFGRADTILRQGVDTAVRAGNLKWELYLRASIADIERDEGKLQPALESYTWALDNAWAVNDAYITVYLMDAIADSHRLMGNVAEAESAAARAMAQAEKTGGDLEMGICLVTAGLIKRQQEEMKDAVECLEKALPYLRDKGAHRELATACFHLAGVYYTLNRKKLALEMLERCAETVKELGYDHFLLLEAGRNPLLVQYASANKAADGYFTRVLKLIKTPGAGKDGDAEDGDEIATDAVQVHGFGHAKVDSDGHEISDLEWRSEKSKEMFFFFLCNRRPLRKEEIVTAMWPDLADDKATNAFHSNMYRLRKALYQGVISKDSGRYALDPQKKFVFDVEEYGASLAQADALKGTPEAIPIMEKAMSLYKGQFAPEFYSEWVESLRWQMEEQYRSLLANLATAYNEAGEYKKSADVCQKLLEIDEFNEAGWYRLLSNYVQSGQQEAAKYCFNRYIQILSRDEMDEEDLPEFEDLVREIKAG
jgi:ATP/maltotriose-dependent transcriptional regulator MalT/DNA-binding SARP family transcriptional activator